MLYSLIDFIKYNSRNNQEIANEYEGSENRFSSEKLATIAFKLTEINYECKYKYTDANNIFDVLGFFSTSEPKRISMCHELIRDHAIAMSLPYPILFHIIAVHEYAHMIHFYFNKTKFEDGEIGFENRTYYVESWAQWCTFNYCKNLDEANNSEIYTKAFNRLNLGQSGAYHDFKRFDNWDKSAVIHLFLNSEGWNGLVYDNAYKDLAKETEIWGNEVRQLVAKNIEIEMTKDVDNIKFKLKSAWKNEEFKSIKTLIQIPEEFKKHHLSKLEGFSTLYSRGLIY